MDDPRFWPISGINLAATHLTAYSNNDSLAEATGFFFKHNDVKYLVTNRHVIVDESDGYYPNRIEMYLHTSRTDAKLNRGVSVDLYSENAPSWFEHPRYDENICDVVLLPLQEELIARCIINFMTTDNIPPAHYRFPAFCQVAVVGYPLGFYDQVNNLPIYRNAMVASPYPHDFEDKPALLIDAVLHEGTSGAMVLNSPSNLIVDTRNGATFHTDSAILFGIHSAEMIVGGEPLGLNTVWHARLLPEIANSQLPGTIRTAASP